MNDGYKVLNEYITETVISRSRFLSLAFEVKNEQQAVSVIDGLRKKYYDSSHICYAYRLGERAERVKFSDDGEPQGTAGAPILEALKSADATFSLIAVVRWFGGVKLGAGGLTRAYRGCAEQVIKSGGVKRFKLCRRYRITCDFSLFSPLTRAAAAADAKVENQSFSQSASFELQCFSQPEPLIARLTDLSGGKLTVEDLGETYAEV